MFKLVSLALGFLTVMTIAPNARSTTAPTRTTPSGINGNLHAQKLMPLKRSTILSTTAIPKTATKKTLSNRKAELSPASKESQRIKTVCQREFNDLNRFGSNERPVGFPDSTSNNNFGNFNQSSNIESCGFSIPFP